MATGFCTRCGAVLERGACPRGHPQRALRARKRRRRRWPFVLLILFLLVASAAYAGLVWYPVRAAGDLMRPSSSEYVRALEAYRAAVDSLPEDAADPEEVGAATDAALEETEGARQSLANAQINLEERSPRPLPVISDRPPLDGALGVRETMLSFYTGALEAVAGLDGVARYLSRLVASTPQLDDLEDALRGASGSELGDAIATANPIAGRLIADLEAITPPDELGSLHTTLQAIAARIQSDLSELDEARRGGGAPVVEALLDDIAQETQTFRDTVAQAPQLALDTGLGPDLRKLDRQVARIRAGLVELRDDGVTGLTIPS